MNTMTSNKTSEALEVVKRTIYTVQVIALGFFIPFLFVFGITYKTPETAPATKIQTSVPAGVTTGNNTTFELGMVSAD